MMIFGLFCVSFFLMWMGYSLTGSKKVALDFYVIVSLALGAIVVPVIFLDNRYDLDYSEMRINKIDHEIETTRRISEAVRRIK